MEIFLHTDAWVALLSLTVLEIILGVDNIIFISILTNKLPIKLQAKARNLGLLMAMVFRILLLLLITWIIGATKPLFTVLELDISIRDLILIIGGFFLLAKSTTEIHHKLEGAEKDTKNSTKAAFGQVIMQIILLDLVFSFDSILTAVGLTDFVVVMVMAIIISMAVMISFAGKIAAFISSHPSLQILALSFLLLIGFTLMAEGLHFHVPKGYIYTALAFSLLVEVINIKLKKGSNKPVELRKKKHE